MPYIVGTRGPQTLEMSAGTIQSTITTTTSTNASVLVSLSTSTYRSVNFSIQAVQGTNFNVTEIKALHDGSNIYMTEYGTIYQPSGIATYSMDLSLGNLRLLSFPASSNSTTFKVVYSAINN
jgi:hypothetical protein